jgi:hypothetical protein
MAIGGRTRAMNNVRFMGDGAGAAKPGPQSFITGLLHSDVTAFTHTSRAIALSTIPKRTRTYFAPYKPGTAQRIPSLADRANPNNVRATLVARSKLLLTTIQKQKPPAA